MSSSRFHRLFLVDHQLNLFDVALHHRFHEASKQGGDFDMRTIFDGSLVSALPEHAVTLVDNHDTQPLQALEAAVEPWFKPLAGALILLREQGVPCVFYPDLYGASFTDDRDGSEQSVEMPAIECLPKLIEARKLFAHGSQTNLFDDAHCIGFVRHRTSDARGCVVMMSNKDAGEKIVELGPDHSDAIYVDFLGHCDDKIHLDVAGRASFPTAGGNVSVLVRES